MEKYSRMLRERGIKPSYQRIKIIEYMKTHKNHPTARTVYDDLIEEMPTLSLTTVYNALKLFASKGLILELAVDGKETRFDGDTSDHAHFFDAEKKVLLDIFMDLSPLRKSLDDSYEVDTLTLIFTGRFFQERKN